MSRSAPAIHGNTLLLADGNQHTSIAVGTPEWFAWLATATSFSFAGLSGSFSARKDSRRGGRGYWKAYFTRSGQVCRAYLGCSETLTLERLNEVARVLACAAHDGVTGGDATPPAPRPPPGLARAPAAEGRAASPADAVLPTPLLAVKVTPPPVRPHSVGRSRLLGQLNDGLRFRLTLVSAPAGFGKTTLLSQWASAAPCRVAWLTLDHADNAPLRFWNYVIAALRTAYPDFGKSALALLRASREPPAESLPALIANELLSQRDELVLVLDDYQRIESTMIHQTLALLLEYLPAHFHLFISTRQDPPLPIALLRARAQLLEMRAEQLALTFAEADAFLNGTMSKGLSGAEVTRLHASTEGWVTGLQLAALSIGQPGDVESVVLTFASSRNVMDYLTAEVLHGQPEEAGRFLLRTSILDRLCGPLCDALLGREDSQYMLDALERGNVFTVPLDQSRHWFRYHSLFARALRLQLKAREPHMVATLQRRASDWYLANDMPAEAIAHAMYIPDHALAATVIERAGPGLLLRREISTLVDSIAALPDELVRSRPRLCLYRAQAELSTSHWELAITWLQYAEAAVSREATAAGAGDGGPEDRVALSAELERLQLAINAGRGDQFLTLMHFYSSTGWSGPAKGPAPDTAAGEGALAASCVQERAQGTIFRAALTAATGRLHESSALYQQAYDLLVQAGLGEAPIAGDGLGGMAMVAYEWNDLNAAERNGSRGIELYQGETFVGAEAFVCMHLALIRFALGIPDDAFRLIDRLEDNWRALTFLSGLRHAAAHRILFTLRQGDARAARRMALPDARSPDEDSGAFHHLVRYHGTVALAQAALGDVQAAYETLDRALAVSVANGWTWSQIHSLAARATLYAGQGRTEEALADVARALSLAEPEGFVRTFLDCGPTMESLLRHLQRRTSETAPAVSAPYLDRLLAAFRAEASLMRKFAPLEQLAPGADRGDGCLFVEELTPRECEVVQLLLAGASNREIAARLVVAVSTVKRHINSIFGKLNVHNRLELRRLVHDLERDRSG